MKLYPYRPSTQRILMRSIILKQITHQIASEFHLTRVVQHSASSQLFKFLCYRSESYICVPFYRGRTIHKITRPSESVVSLLYPIHRGRHQN